MSVQSIIQSMISKCNAITGRSDATLTAGIQALVDGYGQGGGLAYADELYSNDAESITYTSTSAGTVKTITGITNIAKYPFVVVIIENTNATAGTLKFIRSATVIGNINFAAGSVSATRYGIQHYYPSSGTLTQTSSTSYGLWGYTIATSSNGSLTIRGRCASTYYTSLSGTYKVRVLGIKL